MKFNQFDIVVIDSYEFGSDNKKKLVGCTAMILSAKLDTIFRMETYHLTDSGAHVFCYGELRHATETEKDEFRSGIKLEKFKAGDRVVRRGKHRLDTIVHTIRKVFPGGDFVVFGKGDLMHCAKNFEIFDNQNEKPMEQIEETRIGGNIQHPRKRPNMVKWLMRRAKFKATDVMTDAELEGNVERAGGGAQCPVCGHEYFDHPIVEEYPELHVTCEWRVYKL